MKWDRTNIGTASVVALIVALNAACYVMAPRYPQATFICGSAINAWALVMRVPLGQFGVPAPPPVEEAAPPAE
jgi:hypothetical protein